MSYQDKLRAFADYLDQHPVAAAKMSGEYDMPSTYIYCDEWEDFQEVIKDLDGYEKSGWNGNLTARHKENGPDGYPAFQLSVTISGVCEVRPKVDEDGQPVMRRKTVQVETDEWVQENEYHCPQVWSR